MVLLTSLWLPILLSAVLVFVASSIIHMFLGYHKNDFLPFPNEAAARAPLRVEPGDYAIPYAGSMEAMKSPEHTQKMKEGPIAFITVLPPGTSFMGSALAKWFVFCLVASVFAAYVAGRALSPGAAYMAVFRFTGTTAFIGYTLANWQNVVWYGRSARTMLKSTFDGLVYALLTAGVFGWLWPA